MRSNGIIVYFYANFIYQFSIYFSFIYWISGTGLVAQAARRSPDLLLHVLHPRTLFCQMPGTLGAQWSSPDPADQRHPEPCQNFEQGLVTGTSCHPPVFPAQLQDAEPEASEAVQQGTYAPAIKPWAFGIGALTPRLGSIKHWELTQRKPLEYKTRHHPTTSSTLCRTPHLNNKQNKNTNSIISRQDYNLTQPCPSEGK